MLPTHTIHTNNAAAAIWTDWTASTTATANNYHFVGPLYAEAPPELVDPKVDPKVVKARLHDQPAWPLNLLRETVRSLQVYAQVVHLPSMANNGPRFGREGLGTVNFHKVR